MCTSLTNTCSFSAATKDGPTAQLLYPRCETTRNGDVSRWKLVNLKTHPECREDVQSPPKISRLARLSARCCGQERRSGTALPFISHGSSYVNAQAAVASQYIVAYIIAPTSLACQAHYSHITDSKTTSTVYLIKACLLSTLSLIVMVSVNFLHALPLH